MKKHSLEITVFVCGASTMIMELVGSRLLAPFVGTSLHVWTSIIGVVLGMLSLGYWLGGIIADARPQLSGLSRVTLGAGLVMAFLAFASEFVMAAVQGAFPDVRLGACVGALLLFGVPSVLLGMVVPYAVKLRLANLDSTGATVGRLYALSTLGSIAGTFLAGFVLLAYFGHVATLLLVGAALTSLSLALTASGRVGKIVLLAALMISAKMGPATSAERVMGRHFLDVNTAYNRIWIFDVDWGGRPARIFRVNEEHDSAMYLDGDDLLHEYTRYFDLAVHFKPDLKNTLMIGGAAYSYPKYFLKKYPEARMDVVEIDPGATELARLYFSLKDDSRLQIHHEDARTYLNRSTEKVDAIFGDAFKAYSVPFQLTTAEAVGKMHGMLNEGGVVVLNVIAAIEGDDGRFLRAEVATFKRFFPYVYVYPVRKPDDGKTVQNLILVAVKSTARPKLLSGDERMNNMLSHIWAGEIPSDMPVLEDARAPVEHYASGTARKLIRPEANPLFRKLFGRKYDD